MSGQKSRLYSKLRDDCRGRRLCDGKEGRTERRGFTQACAMLLALVMIVGSFPVFLNGAEAVGEDTGADIMLVYADLQTRKSTDMRGDVNSPSYYQREIYMSYVDQQLKDDRVYLAKNEREGFQIYYREKLKNRAINVTVTDFVNDSGDVLPCEVFKEEFFTPAGVSDGYFADALLPYRGENIDTEVNQNQAVYIELHSDKNQKPGKYTSTVTVKDNSGKVLYSKVVTAIVWNFALPENRYADAVLGLYNNQSSYGDMYRIFRANGINNPDKDPSAKAEAVKLLINYQEYLLSHGISTYEIPRWLVDDDPKRAQLTMADPRRNTFTIPINHYDFNTAENKLYATGEAVLNKYKTLAWDDANMRDYIRDKMYIHLWDEPNWVKDPETKDTMIKISEIMKKQLPGYHAAVPFAAAQIGRESEISKELEDLRKIADIMCPTNCSYRTSDYGKWPWGTVDDPNFPYAGEMIDTTTNDNWFRAWRYPSDAQLGNTYLYTWDVFSQGTFRRILYWQQYALNGSGKGGILHWNCAYWPYDNLFESKTLPTSHAAAQGNGDGVLLYPGLQAGYDKLKPIGSLRLKQLSDGLDDYDYLKLSEEFVGADFAKTQLKEILWGMNKGMRWIFSKEEGWNAWSCVSLRNVRIAMGNAIEKAVNEGKCHDFGGDDAWKLVVTPDENYSGLEIRKCKCGAVESRRTPETKPEHLHVVTHHSATEATCADVGNIEHWTCSDEKCSGKYYSDEMCKTEINDIKVAINPDNHTGETEVRDAKAATCCAEGYTGDTCCTGCNAVLVTGSSIKATGNHVASGSWETDEESHWKVCTTQGCGAIVNKGTHVDEDPKDSICDVCGRKQGGSTQVECGGGIVSYGDAEEETTVELIKQGEAGVTYSTKGTTSYTFKEKIPMGIYTLRVMKAKHATREYAVTVKDEDVTKDVKIHLLGDVDMNGGLNMLDTQKLFTLIKNPDSITDVYQKKLADMDENKVYNMLDIQRLFAAIKMT